MSRRVLLLFSHPAYQRSRANRALLEAASGLDGVHIQDLYELYPDFLVDEERERAVLREHDVIVAQHPFYWYSVPALFKQWQDLVLTHGFAFGPGGTALQGKLWLSTVTTGAPQSSYLPDGLNRFSVEELLRPLEATAQLCGCIWQTPFVLHSGRDCDAAMLTASAEAYRARLIALRDAPLESNNG